MTRPYQICSKSVMDTSDSMISFNSDGVCDHVLDFDNNVLPKWNYGQGHKHELDKQIAKIKASGKGSEFDCILGLSGGVDSSYMLHLAVKEFGLRPLVFHVDGGWNSELAVHNIHVLIDKLGLDLYTEVINWEEMRNFQLAMFKSGVPHLDIPQDHAFLATLYKFAEKHGIRYILNGGNISTEGIRNPLEYFYYGTDMPHIKDILSKYCAIDLPTFPFSSIFRHKIYLRYLRRVKIFRPLDLVPYVKSDALLLLEREYSWRPYPQKHFESRFTKFFESFWLPKRFGFDPRRVQLSSLIVTGQLSRNDALLELEKSSYDPSFLEQDFEFVAAKLGVSVSDLNNFFSLPKKFYWDYKNRQNIFNIGARFLKYVGLEASVKR